MPMFSKVMRISFLHIRTVPYTWNSDSTEKKCWYKSYALLHLVAFLKQIICLYWNSSMYVLYIVDQLKPKGTKFWSVMKNAMQCWEKYTSSELALWADFAECFFEIFCINAFYAIHQQHLTLWNHFIFQWIMELFSGEIHWTETALQWNIRSLMYTFISLM